MQELLIEYVKKFKENFPTKLFVGSEEDMKKVIINCLKKNEPYKPKKVDRNLYY